MESQKLSVLVVDDDSLIAQALAKILETEGFHVIAHTDPVKASEERGFAIVLTDFMMPNLTGIELLQHVKANEPKAVRMMLTAAADFKVALEAVNRGEVYRLLSKPWQLAELQAAVRNAADHYRLQRENERLGQELALNVLKLTALNGSLEQTVIDRTNGLLDGMVRALDTRDTETQWHSRRVSLYARCLGEALGIRGADLETVTQGALLHDVGKIGVRDSILLKPGPLTPEEWVEMKRHPELGWRMLASIPWLNGAAEIVYQHQERYDAGGYPRKLGGTNITLGARIFAIVDALDAITSDRPYRKGRPFEVARSEITRVGGTQLDPDLVKAWNEVPEAKWQEIRHGIERLEAEDRQRFGEPMPKGPG